MMPKKTRAMLTMATIGAVLLVLATALIVSAPYGRPIDWLVRGTAIVGYACIFLAIVSSAYLRQMTRLVGRPFMWVHHVLAVAGLTLIVAHPVLLAINYASAAVFVPVLDSWAGFVANGGRVAIYLLMIGATAARLRKAWPKGWRPIHMLNYVAFWLATAHAVLVGTDFGHPVVRWVPIAMAMIVVGVLMDKHVTWRSTPRS